MSILRSVLTTVAFRAIVAAVILSTAVALAQQSYPSADAKGATAATAAPAPPSQPAPARSRRKTRRKVAPAIDPNLPGAVAETPEQRSQDQRLLQQQTAASQATKQVNDQQVQSFDANRQKVQDEPRIQDAPGPAQLPVPAATADPQAIQDAPGPAQTVPPAAPAQPSVPPPDL